jgi:hypothetical protein
MATEVLAFHELSFVPDGDEVVVGRVDTGVYVVLDADGAELLHRLAGGMTPSDAAGWYEARFGEPVNIVGFVGTLRELEFVRDTAPDRASGMVQVPKIRFQRLGRALFSWPAWLGYAGLVATWVVLLVRLPQLRPAPLQVFFTGSLLAVQLAIALGQAALVFLHEAFHALAGRRLGLPTRLGLSNRWIYLVAETELNALFSVPRRKRYLPFLAGMLCDLLIVSILTIAAELTRNGDGSLPLASRFLLALAFTVLMRLAWQFQLYLRTDLYYVFATALNCYDLHEAGKALLRNRLWRAVGRRNRLVDEEQWTERSRRAGTWYGPFLVLGVLVMLLVTLLAAVPVTLHYLATVLDRISSGRFDGAFWDALVSAALNIGQFVLVGWLSVRRRRGTDRTGQHLRERAA